MSPKKRLKHNRGLPRNWQYRYGAYYYRVPVAVRDQWDGKTEFRLGKTLAEAHATFAERVGYEGSVVTVADLCDRYALEVVPSKAAATRRSNQYSLRRIRQLLGHNRLTAVDPQVLYQYQEHVVKHESVKKARLDHEVLSHMFTRAIRWGLLRSHPMADKRVVKPSAGRGRKVLPTLEDVTALAATLPEKWQLYVALKVWTGRRKGELLRVKKADISLKAGTITFTDNKSGEVFDYAMEPEVRAIVERLLRLRDTLHGLYLFSTREGKPYMDADGNASGFDSIWQRYRNRAFADGVISVKFTEHDLRKVRASQLTLEQAKELLQHTNAATTERYRPRNVVRIEQK